MILQFSVKTGRQPHTGRVESSFGQLVIVRARYCPISELALSALVEQTPTSTPRRTREYAADAVVNWLECYAAGMPGDLYVCALEGDESTQKVLRQRGYVASAAYRHDETLIEFTRRE